jgi:hypothetical protein
MHHAATLLIAVLGASVCGCGQRAARVEAPSTQPLATEIDPASAEVDYWYAKPAAAVSGADYDRVWQACAEVLDARRFEVDRREYREGLMTSRPLTSKQFFEVWRHDTASARDTLQSSLGTVRRTVRFEVRRLEDGTAAAAPKVVVERFSGEQRRVTAVPTYRRLVDPTERASMESPRALDAVGPDRWYAIGRDAELEAVLLKDLRERVVGR